MGLLFDMFHAFLVRSSALSAHFVTHLRIFQGTERSEDTHHLTWLSLDISSGAHWDEDCFLQSSILRLLMPAGEVVVRLHTWGFKHRSPFHHGGWN